MARVPDSVTVRNVVAPATTRYPYVDDALERVIVDETRRGLEPPETIRWPYPEGCIIWKGVWEELEDGYSKYDAVYYNGSSYVSNTEYNTDLPTESTWDMLAQQGDAGTPGGVNIISFAYGDATPTTIITANEGSIISEVQLYIVEAFDGVGAAISVGDAVDNTRYMDTNENDPSMETTFNTFPTFVMDATRAISLYITPGAGANHGAGFVVVVNLET